MRNHRGLQDDAIAPARFQLVLAPLDGFRGPFGTAEPRPDRRQLAQVGIRFPIRGGLRSDLASHVHQGIVRARAGGKHREENEASGPDNEG